MSVAIATGVLSTVFVARAAVRSMTEKDLRDILGPSGKANSNRNTVQGKVTPSEPMTLYDILGEQNLAQQSSVPIISANVAQVSQLFEQQPSAPASAGEPNPANSGQNAALAHSASSQSVPAGNWQVCSLAPRLGVARANSLDAPVVLIVAWMLGVRRRSNRSLVKSFGYRGKVVSATAIGRDRASGVG